MKKEIPVISIVIILSILSICGCIDETSKDGDSSDNKEPKTVYVNVNGGADFTSIQKAINNIDDGDIIFVFKGTYNEALNINKTINLIGENKEETIIYFNRSLAGIEKSTVIISEDNCVIKGFKINCGEFTENNKGIKITSSNNIISDNIVIYGDDGIYIEEGSKNNNISQNNFSNSSKAIMVYYSDHNNISKNNFSYSSNFCIYLLGSDYNAIFSNNFSNNNEGIHITGSNHNRVFENNIINNNGGILFCCESKNNIIFSNSFIQNLDWHAYLEGENLINKWDYENVGNYWDDYEEKYSDAEQENGIWQTPYTIDDESNQDNFPLVSPIDI